jgi:hypothetical protein
MIVRVVLLPLRLRLRRLFPLSEEGLDRVRSLTVVGEEEVGVGVETVAEVEEEEVEGLLRRMSREGWPRYLPFRKLT